MLRVLSWLVVVVLAMPALVLTAGRLVRDDTALLIRLHAFTPLAIPLYAALVVVLAVWWARDRGWRSPRPVLTALALAGLGAHLGWFAPQVTGATPDPGEGATATTVMTANLFEGRGDADDVMAAVRRDGVDLLVLAEITPEALARLDAAGLGEVLPHRAGAAEPFVAGTMVFAGQPITESALLATGFNSYRVEVGGLTVLAVHPVAPTLPRAWRADHDVVRGVAEDVGADLVIGDLNATPDHTVMRELRDAGFRSAAEVANEGWQPTWPADGVATVPILPPTVQIDHVLLGPSMTASATHTVDVGGSDHLGVVARVAPR